MSGLPYRLDGLELAAGQVLAAPALATLPAVPAGWTPRDALAAAVLPALERGPCFVSFSGGRDSSAVLAVAAATARRHGLPLPVPVTKRYPGVAESDEREWQEAVVRRLRLDDWLVLDLDPDEQHVLGPAAEALLRRHGPLWPPQLHLQLPTLEAARGGSLLTGVGGDEILGGVRFARTAAVLRRAVRPRPRDILRIGYALSPGPVKARYHRRRLQGFGHWLRPPARRRAIGALARQAASEPVRPDHRLRWWLGLPYLRAGVRNLAYLAEHDGVELVHPLLDPGFAATLAALPADRGYRTRDEAMRALFADLLPESVLTRRSKASFDVIDAPGRRLAFLERWTGAGVDPDLVDLDVLRAEWARPLTDPSTGMLLHTAYLATLAASAPEPEQLVCDRG